MVGEPPRRRRVLLSSRQTALRPGPYVVYDKQGRRFTTANDKAYAERLAERLGGRVEEEGDVE